MPKEKELHFHIRTSGDRSVGIWPVTEEIFIRREFGGQDTDDFITSVTEFFESYYDSGKCCVLHTNKKTCQVCRGNW